MKKLFVLLISFLALVLTGCGDNDWTDKGSGKSDEEGFSLSYIIPGAITAVTQATVPIEQGEDQVNSLYILFFENKSDGSGGFVDAIDALEAYTIAQGSTGTLTIEFPETSPLKNSATYKMLFCANIDEYAVISFSGVDGLKAICQGQTESQVASMLLEVSATKALRADNLPMSATAIKAANQKDISIELIRAVSRFDVYSFVDGYDLVSASIWNAYPESRIWDAGVANYSEERIGLFYGMDADADNKIAGGLYAFENYVESPSQNDEVTTCLILGLKKEGSNQVRYFRTNIHPTDMGQKLTRNNVYNTSIKGVNGDGDETPYDAYLSSESNLEIDINGWMLDTDGNVQYDGENMLVIPTSTVTLFPEGETRVYNVYAISETEALQITDNLPSGITARLEKSSLNDYTYTLTITAGAGSMDRSGTLSFTLGKLKAQIRVTQAQQGIPAYLSVDADELLTFSSAKGETSGAITVTSSGSWVATIYNGTNFSFASGNSQVTQVEGEPATSFNIHTILANQTQGILPSFVIVKLKDNPDVSRAIMLEQQVKEEPYIRFNPAYTRIINMYGETITNIRVESNVSWKLSFTTPRPRSITFTDNGQKVSTLQGSGNKLLTINIPANDSGDTEIFYLKGATTDGSQLDASVIFNQPSTSTPAPEPTPEKEMIFLANGTGVGSLVNPYSADYQKYVYVLGSAMRDKSKFGNGGSIVNLGKDGFQYMNTFNSTTIPQAKIIQLLSNPSASNFNRIYKNMQEDPTAFLMITSTYSTDVTEILKQFEAKTNAGYGAAVNVTNAATNIRPVSSAKQSHPLMQYLLKGPGGNTSISNINLMGNMSTMAGLPESAYPKTFIPILMSRDYKYCVFGIDPVNRLIIMTDPGVFGPHPTYSSYPSSQNFSYSGGHNWIFLNNLTAWIMSATGIDGFLKDFQ